MIKLLRGLLRAADRGINRFCDVMDSLGRPPEWRVEKYQDGLWYVEFDHLDQGWVCDSPGYRTMIEAATAGRRRGGNMSTSDCDRRR